MKLPSIDLNNIEQYARYARSCGESLLCVRNKPLINDLQNLRYLPLCEDVVKLTEKAKFEKTLRTNYTPKPVKITANGSDSEWCMFNGSQFGSQDAFWAKNNTTGDLFYVKFAQDAEKEGHIESEILASRLYNLAGIETPEIIPVTINGQFKGLASKFTEGVESGNEKLLRPGFAADAWLANWDSLLPGNTFINADKIVKVDNGGALRYRAMGGLKSDFGDTVDEIITLVDGRNWTSKAIYSKMSHAELVSSFESVCSISDKAIRQTVSDKNLAQTLINRRNYMREVLVEIKENPRTKESMADYFTKIANNIAKKHIFNIEAVSEGVSKYINTNIKNIGISLDMPSTKSVIKNLVEELKSMEKSGIKVSEEDIINLFKTIADEGVDMNLSKFSMVHRPHLFAMEDLYSRLFYNLSILAEKTPRKDGERISTYVNRLEKLREKRIQQMDNFRIKMIKSRLKYEPELEPPKIKALSPEIRAKIIDILEDQRERDLISEIYLIPKLNENSTDKKIFRAWQAAHMGGKTIEDDMLSRAVMQLGGRYNAKHPIKTKARFERIAEKNYKQEFDIEPVYHWFGMNNPEKFVKRTLPNVGEIYTVPERQCCSTHKHYAEGDYGDHVSVNNIKFIMHPKSETSRAYNLGLNQEVIYPAGEQFRILDKQCVEYIDPETGAGYPRWEVHMQEV